MTSTTQTHKSDSAVSDGNHENQILELDGPKRYSVQGLAEMASPERACPDGKERFYAVAQIDAVESTGPTAEENEEVRLILYANADVSRCIERVVYPRVKSHGRTPRVIDVDPEHEDVGEPSARTRDRYVPIVERHRELGMEVQG